MLPEYAGNWYTAEQVAEITGQSMRTVRTKLAVIPDSLYREDATGTPGRPRRVYHAKCMPQLWAAHAIKSASSPAPASVASKASPAPAPASVASQASPAPAPASAASQASLQSSVSSLRSPPPAPAADDLAVGQLRMLAVRQLEETSRSMRLEIAVAAVCAEWSRKPRTETVCLTERLDGGHRRKGEKVVMVGNFSQDTLLRWYYLYRAGRKARLNDAQLIIELAPRLKTNTGRTAIVIPDDVLDFVALLASSTVRADVAKAVAKARPHIPEEFRDISISTWRRRILARDPRKAAKALMHSVSRYRQLQSPDIEIDWAQLQYNGRWELDDVQKDWYAYSTDLDRLIRPFGYAIMRTRTRQWVAFAASETEPTADRVRELIGFALCNPFGGIPESIKFEHGTVACDPDLESLLVSLGIKVSRTSMDSGAAATGMVPDRAKGHFQGKAIIEANFRRMHNIEWSEALQVGPEERHTAPPRLERIKALVAAAHTRGEMLPYHRPEEWYPIFSRTMDTHNNTPHSALPQILDPVTAKPRHMTPNECAASLGESPIKLMDPRVLPRFIGKCDLVPVTKNGFILNNNSYGRFDAELQTHREVHVFASTEYPAIAYVQELGRTVSAYVKEAPGESTQFEKKRHMEKSFRNNHEALMARCIESGQPGIFDMLIGAANPTPTRRIAEIVAPAAMLQESQALVAGVAAHRDRQESLDNRFLLPESGEQSESDSPSLPQAPAREAKPAPGILAHASDLAAQVSFLNGDAP